MQKSFMAKKEEIKRNCYVIDANNKVLGKIAAKAASILRGKHKATFTPHVDTGDMVIITNAAKVRVTGNKFKNKEYQQYSGFHSGQKTTTFDKLIKKSPTTIIELAVKRMIPSGPLGNSIYTKLKVYAGEEHPHSAQKPVSLEV